MGRNRIRVGVVVLARAVVLSGCASEASDPDASGSPSARPSASARPSPSATPSPTPSASTPTDAAGDEDGHDDDEHATHPPADPSLLAATAYSTCVTAGRSSLFVDDPDAAWQPFDSSYVQRVDGVWRVHSGVSTTSSEGAGEETAAYCQVNGSEAAPVVLTLGVTLAPPSDPGLWASPEG